MKLSQLILPNLFMLFAEMLPGMEVPMQIKSPIDGAHLDSALTAILEWKYPPRASEHFYFFDFRLEVSTKPDFSNPIVDINLRDHNSSFRLATSPETKYFWRLTPFEVVEGKPKYHPERGASASFTTGKPVNDFNATDSERYRNPREGSHWQYMTPVEPEKIEPLSPWYEVKAYNDTPPPKFADTKDKFPTPVWEGHPEALKAWDYCFDTILKVWCYGPLDIMENHDQVADPSRKVSKALDHQAVGNLIGYRTWGPWGSTMVWDTCFMLHFARYGANGYQFITGLDNCYARQHENGFICRESDRANREVYVGFPTNPPLFAWTEWEWYQITGDKERLRRVLLPIVRHYEWWMKYQRRENGLYWTQGMNEADDSPRNEYMYYAVSASSYQCMAARYLSLMSAELGRDDLKQFFDAQNIELGELVNKYFWDEKHQIYNDLDKNGKPITEPKPGVLCKHVHMFWPLMAGIVPPDRLKGMVAQLKDPNAFLRKNGVPSLSADSEGFNPETGQYWRGSVWPPTQCMVQEGLEANGEWDFLLELATKYYYACIAAYQNDGTMRENLTPDSPKGCGAGDFVGWAGIGPVANLVEYVFGMELDAPTNTITWRIRQTEEHGMRNLAFNGKKIDLICKARKSAGEKPVIHVKSDGDFKLVIEVNGKKVSKEIAKGEIEI